MGKNESQSKIGANLDHARARDEVELKALFSSSLFPHNTFFSIMPKAAGTSADTKPKKKNISGLSRGALACQPCR